MKDRDTGHSLTNRRKHKPTEKSTIHSPIWSLPSITSNTPPPITRRINHTRCNPPNRKTLHTPRSTSIFRVLAWRHCTLLITTLCLFNKIRPHDLDILRVSSFFVLFFLTPSI